MQRSHSPARRLARTIKALGPVTGRAFGRHAIQGIRGIAEGSGEDVGGLIFWWCNCVALRVMLTSDRFEHSLFVFVTTSAVLCIYALSFLTQHPSGTLMVICRLVAGANFEHKDWEHTVVRTNLVHCS
jgi:hypothetical protein